MQKKCTQCGSLFEATDADLQFYKNAGPPIAGKNFPIPAPSLCFPCRMQRRIAHRNFFNLCHRKCDLSGKRIISMYGEDAPFPVFEMHEWWSDRWDALQYGRKFDPSCPFFHQLQDLFSRVPRMAIVNVLCENTDYCNFSFSSKNCYLIGGNVGNEDCCYGHIVWQSKDCVDCLYVYRCEWCYGCVDCVQSYGLAFSRGCENCSYSTLLVHCSGCKNCFGCVGLRNKEYHLFNQPLSRDEYERRLKEFDRGSRSMIEAAKKRTKELCGKEIVKHYHGMNCEDVTGDYLYRCKGVFDSFDAKNCEDSRFLATAESFINCYDCNYCPSRSEWCNECVAVTGSNLLVCHNSMNQCANLMYCQDCSVSRDCFGCQSLKGKQYCVLNKQYTREEYEVLVPKIIEHMQKTQEWGHFFPIELSPFGYNQTMAQEYFPLGKEEILSRGWKWWEEPKRTDQYLGPSKPVLDNIRDVPDSICESILQCEITGKPYKIIPQELKYCREMRVPLPAKCFDKRHRERMALRNPRKLWNRTCGKCKQEIQTTYSPEKPETVYCEECYLKEVY